ncbi:MAG: HPr kinase/phosphorylase [Gallionellales bacterium 35-53-114]|jgi:HPr kinase/phosphorylase|nr:MAG: HPr kinase/phosphorylase [Gallionellales bacterium 35-53-114]OYZ63781.1 MAG: HPr kinase/phosphorylase [Gallionellales bacterium 24-53-125]OZB09387.1 MAG: HPr kinase/phosphorylase [Gallionellales bacterium 39-52-133]HQS57957.1 HPr(Ser) kinase/phosphatase [Gallionellaceae bacterium]HQS76118.1 HPr(Ser) kinase/phosphatase [Gallionellaceae bacterium]
MAQVNIRQLFDDKQERLALSWVAGSDGSNKILDSELVNASNRGLIGHLNLIHPNWVQVLSSIELDYLRDLSPDALDTALAQLESGGSLCLIVAGTDEIPQAILEYADRTQTPLFRSPQGSVHLMWLVRHYIVKELAESTTRHGVFLDVLGVGVLITGDSGVGKSELGLELITRGNGLVADDVTELFRISPETLEGRCPELLRDFLEVRGLGMLNIRTMFGETSVRRKKSLKLIVHLHRPVGGDVSNLDRLPIDASYQEVLGIKIKTVSIPVVAGRNLAVLVEAAARNFVLQQRGIDTMKEFIERHERQMLEQ